MSVRACLGKWAVLAALSIVAAGCGAQPGNAASSSSGGGQEAAFPEFTVKTLDNQSVKLNRYRGKILILDLFATWCPPCKMEIPHFVALQKEHADKLAVVGLAFDQSSPEELKAFIKTMNINYDVYWGNDAIAQYVGLRGIPHTLVLDPQGRVFRSYVGYRDQAVFEKDIQALHAKAGNVPKPAPSATQSRK